VNRMKKVRIVLVGIGGYGAVYVNQILCPDIISKVELVGIVDPFPDSCKRLSELTAICGEAYASLRDFYQENSADLAVISTPIQFHTENIITALQNGSDVLCEKPLCGDAGDIEKLLAAEKESGHHVHIGYQWSHSEAIQRLKKDIMNGLYGEPLSLKTLILWPRDRNYFKRGTGWAGKIRSVEGELIYDSVANNAAAHYLHNMFYVTGSEPKESRQVSTVAAELYRVNDIENFDTAVIRCVLENGGEASFIASHAVEKAQNPMFDYQFTRGRVTYTQDPVPEGIHDADAYSVGQIIGVTEAGEVRNYGDPFEGGGRKLYIACSLAAGEKDAAMVCGIKAAAVHTRVINQIGEKFVIHSFPTEIVREREGLLYVEGLFEKLIAVYDGRKTTIEE